MPYWAIPLSLIFGEMAYIFRRRGNRAMMFRMGALAVLFIAATALFFVFRWDVTLYPWIRELLAA